MALDEKKLREAGLPASLISLLISITKAADRASAAAAAAGDGGGSITWADINDKPATFPPSDHSHAPADITELQAAVEGWTVRTSDGVSRIVPITQAAYDALGTKVATTLYLITS
ncbi:hypothetical protein PY32053_00798 [Paracoccus yeei]|uniref:Minor tail protein gp31 C-terminal domain-containing protein n=1 Tax=Paracoccus yeei TaxID=147645 RepID=A0A386UIJ1_9RHOB|nr:hypothetical protein [Paracoccus yeei]AYF00473.1 hypothetical protein PY32053_00798 [Paracoccus yeei]